MKIIQTPSLPRLCAFERISWPEEEQASPAQLQDRLEAFPPGIFLLEMEGQDVAQFTIAPKQLPCLSQIRSFTKMRDLEVDTSSLDLWGTNLAVDPTWKGQRLGDQVVIPALLWAQAHGYKTFTAGMTCPRFAKFRVEGKVQDIRDYMEQEKNATVNLFRRVANSQNWHFEQLSPIENYWPEDLDSGGYGVVVRIRW